VDSAAVLAMARAHEPSLATFTIGFRDPRYDERPRARAAAKYFGSEHHEVEVGADDFLSALPRLAWHRDEPIAEPSEVPLLLLAESAAGKVKVVLTGDAGDEVFGGYPKYRAERFLRRAGPLGGTALAVGTAAARLRGSHRQLDRAIETARIDDRMLRWVSWFRSFGMHEIRDLVNESDGAAAADRLIGEARSASRYGLYHTAITRYNPCYNPERKEVAMDYLRVDDVARRLKVHPAL